MFKPSQRPLMVDETDSSCILCCSSGPVHVTLYSERSGFFPGEILLLNGEVYNKGNSKVKSTHVELIQVRFS